ncbi:shikimate 5-dehydrogenase [Helicobacter mustelae]|uniref:shikimate dehydrogenase n=1 Tax=Helicobacter mustelae TaxID=217 RepID=UPI000DFF057D|nr:shikimate dehydrogenase [Helicobacter mustelae]STP13152.1 shikimate 5-dehydrogenase [Helicobacter mustelae]
MKQFCVFGNPITHSLSPLMHNHAFLHLREKIGFCGFYGRYLLRDPAQLRQKFFDLSLSGANITLPLKESAFAQSDVVEGIGAKIGAVNTWVLKNQKIYGYNTDAPGFYQTIKDLSCERFLILGAGGSARAIATILQEKGKKVCILNRSATRLESLRSDFACVLPGELEDWAFDMVVNTTSASMQGVLPMEEELLAEIFSHASHAYELLYGMQTPFLQLADRLGLQCTDGREMLIAQGALAFELFCGRELKEAFPIMQEALL